MTIRSAYGKKINQPSPVGKISKTKQSFKDECDINNIMAKYQKTGLIDHFSANKARYGFAPAADFRESLEIVHEAETLFRGLPSKIRRKFEESPEKFLAFCEDPDNRSEMALLGLLNETATADEAAKLKASDSASAPVPPNPATTDAE